MGDLKITELKKILSFFNVSSSNIKKPYLIVKLRHIKEDLGEYLNDNFEQLILNEQYEKVYKNSRLNEQIIRGFNNLNKQQLYILGKKFNLNVKKNDSIDTLKNILNNFRGDFINKHFDEIDFSLTPKFLLYREYIKSDLKESKGEIKFLNRTIKYEYDILFNKIDFSINNFPNDPELIGYLCEILYEIVLKSIKTVFTRLHLDPKKVEAYEIYYSIAGVASVISSHDPREGEDLDPLGHPIEKIGEMSKDLPIMINSNLCKFSTTMAGEDLRNKIFEWYNKFERSISAIVKKSEDYAEIVNFKELNFNFKIVPLSGAGFVILRNKKFIDSIYCPDVSRDCFFLCIKEAGAHPNKSIRKIKKEMEINEDVPINKINAILRKYFVNTQIILHKKDKNSNLFQSLQNAHGIPRDLKNPKNKIHLGFVYNHFFLVKDLKALKEMTINDFEFLNEEEYKIEKIDKKEIHARDLEIQDQKKPKEIYIWDIETFLNEKNEHVPYAIGYKKIDDEDTKIFYGNKVFNEFIKDLKKIIEKTEEEINTEIAKYKNYIFSNDLINVDGEIISNIKKMKMIEMKKKELINNNKIIFIAHNGGKFDLEFLFKNKKLKFHEIILNNGIISLSAFGGLVEFRDSMKMTGPRSLNQLCKDFNLPAEFSKGDFPHKFIKKDNLNYIGPVPAAEYWPKKEIPEEYLNIQEYNIKEECIKYLKLDCISLGLIWNLLNKNLKEITNMDISAFKTGPSYSYNYVFKNITNNYDIKIIKNRKIDYFIRKAIQGGRCIIQKSKFISNEFNEKINNNSSQEELEKYYNSIQDYLIDFDAVSLYPSAMALFEYPIGYPHWVKEDKLEILRNQLNNLEYNKHSIIECDIIYSEKNKIICPLLSSKNKDGRLNYNIIDKTIIKTSVDLMEEIKYNKMEIVKIHSAIEWYEKAPIFRETITDLFNKRLEAKKIKNTALDLCTKMLMNSCYGKTTQKIHDDKLKIFNDTKKEQNKINKLYREGLIKQDITLKNKKQCLINFSKKKLSVPSFPSHLGAFILAYSKKIMNECIDGFDGFEDWEITFYYTDTDSLHIHIRALKKLKETCPDIIGKNMGQLHDDLPLEGGKIIRSLFIRPKLYIDEIIAYEEREEKKIYKIFNHIRAKGVPRDNIKNLNFEKYNEMFRGLILDPVELKRELTHSQTPTGSLSFNSELYKRNTKKMDEPAIKIISQQKIINRVPWDGRIYNKELDRWE
ncbi:MAG: DNA polymerase, partial [Promethearchaeia archaeon]